MAKLPKSIIKKYGITKKAWNVYRNKRKRKTRTSKPKPKIKRTKRRVAYMARKKKTYRKKRAFGGSVFGVNVANDLLYPGVYGAARGKLAAMVLPIARNLPVGSSLGNVYDEVAMISSLALVKKFIKNPTVRNLCVNGIRIEAAQIGQAIATGSLGIGGGSTSTQSFR